MGPNVLKEKEEHCDKLVIFFGIGDALPPYNGKLRLFAMRFCPYAERSVLVLNAKKLEYDLVFVNLDNKPEWVFQYSPKGKYINM